MSNIAFLIVSLRLNDSALTKPKACPFAVRTSDTLHRCGPLGRLLVLSLARSLALSVSVCLSLSLSRPVGDVATSHRRGRARCAPWVKFKVCSAQMLARCPRCLCENNLHRPERSSFTYPLGPFNSPQPSGRLSKKYPFFTSGCAVETDEGEQEMEHTTVTYDAAAERVSDRVEGHISASGLQL